MRKIIFLISFMILSWISHAAYTEIDCGSDAIFWENTCDQCFDGWTLKQGDNISFLDDIWVNDTTMRKIMYKEEQTMPEIKALNGGLITKKPDNDSFWEYSAEFEALKNTEFDWYVLPAWQKVSWIKSAMWAAYKVDKTPTEWENMALALYSIMSHNLLESGEITMSEKPHKECVLYKAWAWQVETPTVEEIPQQPVTPQEDMTKVKTGPEMYLLILMLSFILGLAFTRKDDILAYIRK